MNTVTLIEIGLYFIIFLLLLLVIRILFSITIENHMDFGNLSDFMNKFTKKMAKDNPMFKDILFNDENQLPSDIICAKNMSLNPPPDGECQSPCVKPNMLIPGCCCPKDNSSDDSSNNDSKTSNS